ncbi:MAG: U32 family peptidase, partial [Syntrophomonadaceae bacterium]|nr:U32 family peptidase [Syntrophomonadaceae bacterium]
MYVGGRSFSARAHAENFSLDQLSQAADYAQLRGVKLYVALNTLINNREMGEALEYARFLCAIGVNAVIVQDLGLLFNLRRVLPELSVHASTQMTTHNLAGVKFLESQGVERVIMARELSLAQLREIAADTSCALEVFVHGALCICYSGQCLFSSLVGGRSGNRGRCAQPCRLYYSLEMIGERGPGRASNPRRKKGEASRSLAEGHLLSPRDLSALHLLPELHRSGVKALKIEGRMKKPEYVATVVRVYRQALDRFYRDPQRFQASPEEWRQLAQIFNRGFTSGYFTGNPGRSLMNYLRPNNRGLYLGRVRSWDGKAQRLAIQLESDLRSGDGIEVWVSRGGRTGLTVGRLEVDGQPVSLARAGQEAVIPFAGRAVSGDRVFKTYDQELERLARNSYASGQGRIPLRLGIRAAAGVPLVVWAVDPQGRRVEVVSEYIGQPAEKHSLDPETARQQLGRMGNTPFVLESLEPQIATRTLVPLSVLNQARRLLLEKLTALRLAEQRAAAPAPEVFFQRKQNLEGWLEQALLTRELSRYGDLPSAD